MYLLTDKEMDDLISSIIKLTINRTSASKSVAKRVCIQDAAIQSEATYLALEFSIVREKDRHQPE